MSVFQRPLQTMRYFHAHHQRELQMMIEQSQAVTSMRDLKSLCSVIQSFCSSLHMHHTIEDTSIFPKIAAKTDISALERHHQQLAAILEEFVRHNQSLKAVKSLDDYDRGATQSMITRVQSLVVEHETAEESMLAAENLQRWFTEQEVQRLLGH